VTLRTFCVAGALFLTGCSEYEFKDPTSAKATVVYDNTGTANQVVTQQPPDHVEIQWSAQPGDKMTLNRPTMIQLRSGYSVHQISAGTVWRCVGSIPQGQVFKPLDSVLMVEAGNNYEGLLVVSDNRAVGVYLPVESAFVTARSPVDLYWLAAR
jgi:hypothetical protein